MLTRRRLGAAKWVALCVAFDVTRIQGDTIMVAMIADPVTVVRVMAAALVEVSPHVVAYASYPVSFSQWSSLRGETS